MESPTTVRAGSLRAALTYEPQPLKFGTSGRRGDVLHLTQLEIYLNALAELEYLQALPVETGGIRRGEEFYFAYDLRPSSTRFDEAAGGRGEIAQAIEQAIRDAGMQPVNLGPIPTPALTAFAIGRRRGSMMITGSHIPFERNGYKTNSARGELLKTDEAPINRRVEEVRARLYHQPAHQTPFNEHGMFRSGHRDLAPATEAGRRAYLERYTAFFEGEALRGRRYLVYQHSAVGRDLLVELLQRLGAEAIPAGRSESFVPIDTENIDEDLLERIGRLVNQVATQQGPLDAVVSTDGDSDRPLLLAVDLDPTSPGAKASRVRFFGGDLLGMVVAELLGADAVVVPISCNDGIDRGALKDILEPKTRIGSPYVIAGMQKALARGRRRVCGWEANGGFLTGSNFKRSGRTLSALPTRDAMLPLLGALFAAQQQGVSLTELFRRLPQRFSKAALLRKFPRTTSRKILERFSPRDEHLRHVVFTDERVELYDEARRPLEIPATETARLREIRQDLRRFFSADQGFPSVVALNYVDGLRVYFANEEIAHVRPSGNADELRIYAVAATQDRADQIARLGIAEPDGILRGLEKAVG